MNLLSHLIAPVQAALQAVVLFFAPHAGTFKPSQVRQPGRQPAHPMATSTARQAARITYPSRTSHVSVQPIHRVRVVRNVDNTLPADRAGRMLVSGRFADVCAELERLAATDMRTA